jgi:hypothetical protein
MPGPMGGPGHHDSPSPETAHDVALLRHEDLNSLVTFLASSRSISRLAGATTFSNSSSTSFVGEADPDADRLLGDTERALSFFRRGMTVSFGSEGVLFGGRYRGSRRRLGFGRCLAHLAGKEEVSYIARGHGWTVWLTLHVRLEW